MELTLATRRSPLALAQTEVVAHALRAVGHEPTLLPLVTTGDRWSATGGDADKGMFVRELESAVLDGRADLAIHSAKDLPVEMPDGLTIAAVPPRADARDVLIGPAGGLPSLTSGSRVATGSARRSAQLLRARPDLRIVDIRGNVDTRLEKLAAGSADALVLAAAGLERLGRRPDGLSSLPVELSVPAAGQGFLAIQGRSGDDAAATAAGAIGTGGDATCLAVERAVLEALGGGCREPIGAYCTAAGDELALHGFMARDAAGSRGRRAEVRGPAVEADRLVSELAASLGATV